jgi:hypothetical protein
MITSSTSPTMTSGIARLRMRTGHPTAEMLHGLQIRKQRVVIGPRGMVSQPGGGRRRRTSHTVGRRLGERHTLCRGADHL